MTSVQNKSKSSLKERRPQKRGRAFSRFIGVVCIVLFALDIASICLFSFHGASIDTGELYRKPATLPDLDRLPYKLAAAFPYPPVIFNFSEDSAATDSSGNAGYTWLRMNYLAQINPPELNLDLPALGNPSIIEVKDMRSVRPDLMKQIQAKPHDCPEVITVLSNRLVELKNGWVAEIDIPAKTLAFYPAEKKGAARLNNSNQRQIELAPVLQDGAVPSITKPLADYLPANEYPLAIAAGSSGQLLIACSRGSLLKLDGDGKFLSKTRIRKANAGEGQSENSQTAASDRDFWTPVGGIWMGSKLVGVDTVLMLRRIMAIVLLATPLCAYLAFAWSRD